MAVEVWTTNAGIFFDNFAISHSLKDAFAFADVTYGVKEAIETKKADREKREAERLARKKESLNKNEKGGKEGWLSDLLVMIAEWVVDNSLAVIGTLVGLLLGLGLVLAGVTERKRQVILSYPYHI